MLKLKPPRERLGRRSASRYPVVAGVEYKVLRDVLKTGRGHTVNVSSTGVLVEAGDTLLVGERIELSIAWPAKLDEKVGLTLCVFGTIVRVQSNRVAVKIVRHEFRTRSLRPTRQLFAPTKDRGVMQARMVAAS